jgi:hypothetical protein
MESKERIFYCGTVYDGPDGSARMDCELWEDREDGKVRVVKRGYLDGNQVIHWEDGTKTDAWKRA